jgi:hypothetical protein
MLLWKNRASTFFFFLFLWELDRAWVARRICHVAAPHAYMYSRLVIFWSDLYSFSHLYVFALSAARHLRSAPRPATRPSCFCMHAYYLADICAQLRRVSLQYDIILSFTRDSTNPRKNTAYTQSRNLQREGWYPRKHAAAATHLCFLSGSDKLPNRAHHLLSVN